MGIWIYEKKLLQHCLELTLVTKNLMKENLVSQENYHICRFNKQKYFCYKTAIINRLQMFSLSLTNYLLSTIFTKWVSPYLVVAVRICGSLEGFALSSWFARTTATTCIHTCTSKWAGTPSSVYSVNNEFGSVLSIFLSPSSSFCRCPGAGTRARADVLQGILAYTQDVL